MRKHSTCSAMVACRPQMYSCMGCNTAAYSDATTRGYYHYPSTTPFPVIPVIFLDSQWWNHSRTLNTTPRHQPTITAIHQHWLWHCLIHHNMGPHCWSRLHQHPRNNPPLYLRFLQVLEQIRTISIVIGDPLPKVGGGLQQCQGVT